MAWPGLCHSLARPGPSGAGPRGPWGPQVLPWRVRLRATVDPFKNCDEPLCLQNWIFHVFFVKPIADRTFIRPRDRKHTRSMSGWFCDSLSKERLKPQICVFVDPNLKGNPREVTSVRLYNNLNGLATEKKERHRDYSHHNRLKRITSVLCANFNCHDGALQKIVLL